MRKKSTGMKVFTVFNYLFLAFLAVSCLLPIVNQLAISFSSSAAVAAGEVGLWPVDFTLDSYKYMADKAEYWKSLLVSVERVLLAVPMSMLVCVLAAFPLSRLDREFPARKVYIWIFVIPMLIGGGLIPSYMVVRETKLINSIWALVVPNCVNVFNVILLMNFFRSLPKELEEAAYVDGAGYWRTMIQVIMPMAKPSIVTVILFNFLAFWNEYIISMTLLTRPEIKTLPVGLMNLMAAQKSAVQYGQMYAGLVIVMIPTLILYICVQKKLTQGMTLGGLKG